MLRPPVSTRRPASPEGEARALVDELGRLKGQFDPRGEAARAKLGLMARLQDIAMTGPKLLSSYHDLLLFLRAYPDNSRVLREAERQLGAFAARIERYKVSSRDANASRLLDRGVVGTPVSNVFTYRFVSTIARLYPRDVEIDWDAYDESAAANVAVVICPAISWHEKDAIDFSDEDFDPQAWLRLSRGREHASSLQALLWLLSTSGLSWDLREMLYESAQIPVRWTLSEAAASKTGRRVPCERVFFQRRPALGRTTDFRAMLARPAAPLTPLPVVQGREYVRTITEVLGSRCRELMPLSGSSPHEVYVHEPGRGVRIVVYGSLPEIRLPLEANHGLMLIRNGLPIGYGLGSLLFDRCEVAINIFPEYRSGESAFIFERILHLFVAHFGARVLVVRPYQLGEDNKEALESGAFWFYFKFGFRPVRPRVRALANEEWERIAADPSYRSPIKTLRKLARSDVFFNLEAASMDGYEELSATRVGKAVTAFIAREFGGDRRRAETESMRRVARLLGISDWRQWSSDEINGFRRMAPLLACLPGIGDWGPLDRKMLARVVRAKGSRRERDYALLAAGHRRFRNAVEQLAKDGSPAARRR
jgi:hypothetical protein